MTTEQLSDSFSPLLQVSWLQLKTMVYSNTLDWHTRLQTDISYTENLGFHSTILLSFGLWHCTVL